MSTGVIVYKTNNYTHLLTALLNNVRYTKSFCLRECKTMESQVFTRLRTKRGYFRVMRNKVDILHGTYCESVITMTAKQPTKQPEGALEDRL